MALRALVALGVLALPALAACDGESGTGSTGEAGAAAVPGATAVADSMAEAGAATDSAQRAALDSTTAAPPPEPGPGQGAPPATALDSLRLEVRRLADRVDASARSTDSVLAVLGTPAGQAGAGGAVGGRGADELVLQDAAETARSYGIRAFWAVVVLAITFFGVRVVGYALNALSERSAERRLFFKRLVPLTRIVLWTFAVYFIIRVVFAVDAQGLFAAAAAVGVAVGFAAQDLLKNIFGGLVIVFDQPFQVGDKIQVGSSYGEVVSIGLRSTRIVTPEDSLVSVPNAQVVDSQVSNANSGALDCQVVTDLYLPGFVDEARAKAIAYQAAASSRYVYLQKPIIVLVKDEFRETFVTHLKVKAYVLDARHEFAFMSDVTERARAEFRRHGLLTPMHGARAWVRFATPADDGAETADAADAAEGGEAGEPGEGGARAGTGEAR